MSHESELSERVSEPVARSLFVAAVCGFGLRLAVGWSDLRDLATTDDGGLKLALGLMGVGYLACGVVAFAKVRSPASGLFALHCLGQGIHWGGPPSVSSESLQLAIWLVYFIVSMLGISAVLHFTLLFPSPWNLARRRGTWLFLYLPVVLASVLAAARMAVTGPFGETLQGAFLALEAIQVTLYGVLAIVVLAIRYARASRLERRANGLGVMLAGALLGELPYFIASLVAPDSSQPLTLFFLITPLAIAYAILRAPSGGADTTRV